MLEKRDRLPRQEVKELSGRIFDKLFTLDCYKYSSNILIYNSFNNEVCTKEAVRKMLAQKNVYMPRINSDDSMEAVKVTVNTEYTLNRFGIYEPCGSACPEDIIDLAVIPGVAFDKMGGRMGYGKAYYDIYLRGKNIYKLAVCYDFQLVGAVPTDLLDVNMDAVITEYNIYTVRRFQGSRNEQKQ
jgi:5-formyltetrahydrofolate cyclo-ligase